MELVIELSESAYKEMCEHGTDRVDYDIQGMIKNGVVLPKNHGRLKDIDWIGDNGDNYFSDEDGSCCYAWEDIDNAPTIIKADNTGSEG